MYGVAMAAALILLCTSFTSDKAVAPAASPSDAAADIYLYWYSYPADTYLTYCGVDEEINTLELEYDVLVDADPSGGTLLVRGYDSDIYPHEVWPTVYLYGHF